MRLQKKVAEEESNHTLNLIIMCIGRFNEIERENRILLNKMSSILANNSNNSNNLIVNQHRATRVWLQA
jgi:ABC-type uncharacterized transport system substrate-binding protein